MLYLGAALEVCFAEAILRDQHDGIHGDLPIAEEELELRSYAEIRVIRNLRMVDLRKNGAIKMGVPTDVLRANSHTVSREWSKAFFDHPQRPDGVIYSSRITEDTNLAVFDRAVCKLEMKAVMPLMDAPELPDVLNNLKVGLVP